MKQFCTHSSSATCIVELWLCCEVVLKYSFTAKKQIKNHEQVYVFWYVRVTITLQHVSLPALEGMLIMPFPVVATHLCRIVPNV